VIFVADGREASRARFLLGARLFLLAALSSGIGACSRAPRIAIAGQEARLSPALVGVCSVFMKIENPGNGDDALVDARAEVPGTVTQIHDVRDGKMVKSDKIRVPARAVVEMRPGGLHIMVFNLPKDTGKGYEFTLRLVFETSGEKRTSVKISG
jgi:copper(I)-binding protein